MWAGNDERMINYEWPKINHFNQCLTDTSN